MNNNNNNRIRIVIIIIINIVIKSKNKTCKLLGAVFIGCWGKRSPSRSRRRDRWLWGRGSSRCGRWRIRQTVCWWIHQLAPLTRRVEEVVVAPHRGWPGRPGCPSPCRTAGTHMKAVRRRETTTGLVCCGSFGCRLTLPVPSCGALASRIRTKWT